MCASYRPGDDGKTEYNSGQDVFSRVSNLFPF